MTGTTAPSNPSTASTPVPELSSRLEPQARQALVLLLVAVFVVFLNETMMGVAIPTIIDQFQITPALGQWMTTAFALTMAVVIPITGWLLQRLQTRPVFITAMSLFVVGTLIAALAPTFGVLVIGRVVQASGTAIMMPLMMTTVLTIVPMHLRGRIMGRMSIVMSLAPAIGPAVGGLLLQVFSHEWRALFWVMIPIALVALGLGIARIPNVSETRLVPLDVLSIVLSAVGFSGLVFGLSSIGEAADDSAILPPWIPLAIGGIFLALFVVRQLALQRRDAAFLDLRTFKARTYTISLTMLAIGMLSLFGMVIVLPIYLQYGLLLEPSQIGLMLLPGGLAMGLLGPTVGRLYDRFGPRPLVIPGSVLVSAVFWALAFGLGEQTPIWFVVAAHIGLSLGLAFMFTPLFTTGLGSLPRHLYSHGSSILATIQQVAGAAGTAMFVAFLAIGMAATGETDVTVATPLQIASGVHLAFLAGAITTLALVAVSFFVRKPEQPEISDESLHAGH